MQGYWDENYLLDLLALRCRSGQNKYKKTVFKDKMQSELKYLKIIKNLSYRCILSASPGNTNVPLAVRDELVL